MAIARALANDPPVIVADEPTGNLDSRTAHEIFDLFTSLVEHGKTLLVVTHDKEIAAARAARDRNGRRADYSQVGARHSHEKHSHSLDHRANASPLHLR